MVRMECSKTNACEMSYSYVKTRNFVERKGRTGLVFLCISGEHIKNFNAEVCRLILNSWRAVCSNLPDISVEKGTASSLIVLCKAHTRDFLTARRKKRRQI